MSTKQTTNTATEIQIPDDVKVSLKGSMLHCLLYTSDAADE